MSKKQRDFIMLHDGTKVDIGITVYLREDLILERKEYIGNRKNKHLYVAKWSGQNVVSFKKATVTWINEDQRSRSFRVQSKGGCEETFTVKGSCQNRVFGSLKELEKVTTQKTKEDIAKIKESIKKHEKSLKDSIKYNNEMIKKKKKAIMNLSKKQKINICEC